MNSTYAHFLYRGLLTGKVKRGVRPNEGRLGFVADNASTLRGLGGDAYTEWTKFSNKDFDIVETVEEIATAKGMC